MEVETLGNDSDDAGAYEAPRNAVQKLSCDQCRQRKVRCDRVEPCGPCSRKAVQCSYPAGFKPRAKRQRALVSNEYETKLDDLSKKLDRISLVVDSIQSSLAHAEGDAPTIGKDAVGQKLPLSYLSPHYPREKLYGDTSDSGLENDDILTTEATFATNFVQQAVDSGHPLQALPEVKSSLEALRRVLIEQTSNIGESASQERHLASPNVAPDSFNLPPLRLAMAAVQRLRESPRLRFFWCIEIENVDKFVGYFMTVYSGKPSLADLIIVHCGLVSLFLACGNVETDKNLKNEFKSQAMLCRENLETILANLPFNLPCTFDFVLALLMASTYCLQECRLSLSWNYLTATTQMCVTLGYHRDVPLRPERKEARQRRVRLFWLIYMMDKLLSLRLNRPSSIRDEAITVPLELSVDTGGECIHPIVPKWVRISMLHGKVYDDIYSPRALLQPESVREARAREVATELQALFDSGDQVEHQFYEESRHGVEDSLYEVVTRADRISHLSILTLVYRSIQPSINKGSAFCDECLSTAIKCLEEHKRCLSLLKEAESTILEFYVQWALLSAPFVPFFVLFCHVIETQDPSHLESLETVVEILEMLPLDLPYAYSRQRRIFKLMYDVACKYIGSLKPGNPSAQPYGLIPDTPFEMIFAEAGMPVPSQMRMHTGMQNFRTQTEEGSGMLSSDVRFVGEDIVSDHGAELGTWFDQNYQIFNMLQDSV